MPTAQPATPVVLVFAGLDPSGGAGIQADIEAIASMGSHAAPVVTTLTVQNTRNVARCVPVDPLLVVEQARALLQDLSVAACKIGLVDSAACAAAIHSILMDYPDIPVVLDPILASGGGDPLVTDEVREALLTLLVPLTTVLTPNSIEARTLAPEADTLEAAAMALLSRGSELVLLTGTHEAGESVVNTLYGSMRKLDAFAWPRLPHTYHGSGCTLAASIAGLLAHGHAPANAVHEAQQYTWEALAAGYRIGSGQLIPNRFFWARSGSNH